MSSHSRSSSEVEAIQYNEVLPVFLKDFLKDFSFADVRHKVKNLFTQHELKFILEEEDEQRQVVRLFWILNSKESIVYEFLKAIKIEYDWLVDKVIFERNEPSKETERYIDKLKSLRSKHQDYTKYNVRRTDLYMKLLNALKKCKPHHKVVLLGELGTGKKWLTLDACCEFGLMKKMNFKIFWVDLNNCISAEEDLRALQQFHLLLNDSCGRANLEHFDSISNRILALQQQLKAKLQTEPYKDCLLVLENVRNVNAWQRFNLGCKILIITRNKKVSQSLSPEMSELIGTDSGLTQSEFFFLFEKILMCERDKFPDNVTSIYFHSNRHPYLLSIIAQNLYKNKSSWNEWIKNLRDENIRDNKFTTVVETSLNVLSQDLLELYATFSIFAHSISIPVKLLAELWNKSVNDTRNIVDKFHTYSLLNKDFQDDNTMVCTLPFIYSSHLKSSKRILKMINSTELHRKVVKYYKIDDILESRTELNLCDSQHDLYFFCCIGYHLLEAERNELFSQIYLDFGFLEQKMRTVGLLNTLGDLKFYEKEIINLEPRRANLLNDIYEFLPKVEEKLVHSKDTCLLQYALTASGSVYEEALRQVKQFRDKVWFSEQGNFHQRRQIVNLSAQAKTVIYLEQDICLIVLDNDSMVLVDISLDCSNDPILLLNDNKYGAITRVVLFKKNKYILTLHNRGELKLWSIAEDHRRSLIHRRSSKQMVNPLNIKQFPQNQTKQCKQCINESTPVKRGRIVAFHVEEVLKYREIRLHVAFDNGDICVFGWNDDIEEFHLEHIPVLHTQMKNIRFLSKILDKYYMMINSSNRPTFWNLKDSSKVPMLLDWPENKTSLICYEIYNNVHQHYTRIYFIYGDKVLQLTYKHQKMLDRCPNGEIETLYVYNDTHSSIKCAKLSRDERFLVLGTKHGLIVFDTVSRSEILRGNVSETISCVDIYDLDDSIYKYTIICGSEHKRVLNILALRKTSNNTIGWAHNISCISNQETKNPQLEPGVWLLGQKLYDITYDEGTLLVAADSKFRIHQVCATNTKNWSIVLPPETSHRITAMTATKQYAFSGHENGAIFNITLEIFEQAFIDPITYLEIVSEQFLIAATANATKIMHVRNLKDNHYIKFGTTKCFTVFDKYLILLNELGDLLVLLEVNGKFYEKLFARDVRENGDYTVTGYNLQNSHLFLATTTYTVHIYGLHLCNDNINLSNHCAHEFNKKNANGVRVSSLAAATDASLLAIGLSTGDIEIYKVNDIKNVTLLYGLQSHTQQICDMKFSPNNDILVSCSEQLCFWSIAYILNNPLDVHSKKRRSSRFSSQRSADIEQLDATLAKPNGNFLQIQNDDFHKLQIALRNWNNTTNENPWQHKRGPSEKPELLACIKFDGNRAEKFYANSDFTQFNSIDDEGVYYHLTLLDASNPDDQSNELVRDDIDNGNVFDGNYYEDRCRI